MYSKIEMFNATITDSLRDNEKYSFKLLEDLSKQESEFKVRIWCDEDRQNYINSLISTLGAKDWNDLKGKRFRFKVCSEIVYAIGNPDKDIWMWEGVANDRYGSTFNGKDIDKRIRLRIKVMKNYWVGEMNF